MIKEILNLILQNDGTSMLPVVGDYLITIFVFIYNFWFTSLIKIVGIFISSNYLIKTIVAFISFFVTIYSFLYIIKKMITTIPKLTFFAIIKIFFTIFKFFFDKPSKLITDFLSTLKKPLNFLKTFWQKPDKNVLVQPGAEVNQARTKDSEQS